VWALALGLRGILWHQLYDRENDRRGHVATFAAGHKPETIRRAVAWGIFPVEAVALLGILVQADTQWAWIMLFLYSANEWLNSRFVDMNIILVQPTTRYRIIFAEYYQLQFPLTFLFALAARSPAMGVLVAAQLLLFPRCVGVFLTHLQFLIREKLLVALAIWWKWFYPEMRIWIGRMRPRWR
jgi:hypothetical protein